MVGKKGRDYFRRRKLTINHELPAAVAETAAQHRRRAGPHRHARFPRASTVDAVFLVYNEFKSAVQQRVVIEPLLPVTAPSWPNDAPGR